MPENHVRSFLIDRVNDKIILNGKSVTFERFFQEAGQPGETGDSTFELWKHLEGNENKTLNQFFEFIQGKDGKDGRDAIIITILSSKGTLFKQSENKVTALKATITIAGETVTENLNKYAFQWIVNTKEVLVNTNLEVQDVYVDNIPSGLYKTIILPGSGAQNIKVSSANLSLGTLYTCNVYEKII